MWSPREAYMSDTLLKKCIHLRDPDECAVCLQRERSNYIKLSMLIAIMTGAICVLAFIGLG